MSGAAHNYDQDYWQPPRVTEVVPAEAPSAVQPRLLACSDCGTEFVVGARYCHVCGAERAVTEKASRSVVEWFDFQRIREAVGLPVPSLVLLVVAAGCVLAAIITGFIYTATTVLDWQAVQVWRIEWLLAAAVALIAGILLKQSASH